MEASVIELLHKHPYKFNVMDRFATNTNDEGYKLDLSVTATNLKDALNSNLKCVDAFYKEVEHYQIVLEHEVLPVWWSANNNKLFVPKPNDGNAKLPTIKAHPNVPEPRDSICFVNGADDFQLVLWGEGNILYMSSNASLPAGNIAIGSGIVFIGQDVRSAGSLNINCRNSGSIILEKDILFSNNCKLMTDDCHTIVSVETGLRLNPYGGSILIQEHVWVGVQATIMGNCVIGEHNVIGERAFVRNIDSTNNSIIAGVPGKIIKNGITWCQKDIPPNSITSYI